MADPRALINVSTLKRADPYARDIVDSATHVALYTFEFEGNEWQKTEVEGALFVYSRSGEPNHSLMILNRLNTNNLVEPLCKGIELQLKPPFLLYRNAKCNINGIWFYDKDECVRVASTIESLIKESLKSGPSESMAQTPNFAPQTQSNIDIFSMLTKAQDDYKSNKGHVSNKVDTTPSRAPDMASQSVMDFFAKAGSGAAAQMPNVSTLPSPGIFGPRPSDVRDGPLLLQRLMSNPAHSVEHIEKQQRSVTPQEAQTSNGSASLECTLRQSVFSMKSTPLDKNNMQRISSFKKEGPEASQSMPALENDLSIMHLSSAKTNSPPTKPQTKDINQMLADKELHVSSTTVPQQKPALMPPTMFTASSVPIEPLTRNQLLQAFNYLLKHDADFVNKLHEAYVKSFTEKAFSVS